MSSDEFYRLQSWFSQWECSNTIQRAGLKESWALEDPERLAILLDLVKAARDGHELFPSQALELSQKIHFLLSGNHLSDEEFAEASLEKEAPEQIPSQIGNYLILEKIGEGGMGVVYRARRAEVYNREVALKVFKTNFCDPVTCEALIQTELDIHSKLVHKNIATLYDAGRTNSNQYYMVMELIEGDEILAFIKKRVLPIETKLHIFSQLCAGITFAHHNSVIHGDLKPSNVLITEENGEPVVKIIDFGIATVLAPSMASQKIQGRFGTPSYLAPERFQPNSPLTFQTDVYSLGVLFFELLCEHERLDPRFFNALPKPTRLHLLKQGMHILPSEFLARQSLQDSSNIRLIKGDLDAIAEKAFHPNPAQRYTSVPELNRDLERYSQNYPVEARKTPFLGRVWRLFLRQKITATLATLVVGIVFVSAVNAYYQRLETEKAMARLQESFLFFETLISTPHPGRLGSEVKVVEMLAQGEKTLQEYGSVDPELEARVRQTIGEIYFGLGLYVQALNQYDTALQSLKKVRVWDKLQVANLYDRKARVLRSLDRLDPAIELFEQAASMKKAILGSHHHEYHTTRLGLASVYLSKSRFNEAAAICESAWRFFSSHYGPSHPKTLDAEVELANAQMQGRKLPQAIATLENVWKEQKNQIGDIHYKTLLTQHNLAAALLKAQRFQAAHQHFEEISQKRGELLGNEHSLTLNSLHGLAEAKRGLGQLGAAEAILRDVIATQREHFGMSHSLSLLCANTFAIVLGQQNKTREAMEVLQELALQYDALGLGESHRALMVKNNLSHYLQVHGFCEKALMLLTQVVETKTEKWGEHHPTTQSSTVGMAELYEEMGDPTKALFIYESVLLQDSENHPRRPLFQAMYARCLADVGHLSEAQVLLVDSMSEVSPGEGDYAFINQVHKNIYARPNLTLP